MLCNNNNIDEGGGGGGGGGGRRGGLAQQGAEAEAAAGQFAGGVDFAGGVGDFAGGVGQITEIFAGGVGQILRKKHNESMKKPLLSFTEENLTSCEERVAVLKINLKREEIILGVNNTNSSELNLGYNFARRPRQKFKIKKLLLFQLVLICILSSICYLLCATTSTLIFDFWTRRVYINISSSKANSNSNINNNNHFLNPVEKLSFHTNRKNNNYYNCNYTLRLDH